MFRNVRYYDLRALIDFIYQGEVNVMQDQLPSFLATAKLLEVKGLADNSFGSEPPDGSTNHDSEVSLIIFAILITENSYKTVIKKLTHFLASIGY